MLSQDDFVLLDHDLMLRAQDFVVSPHDFVLYLNDMSDPLRCLQWRGWSF
jgi:hypothetical protein